MGKSYGLEKDPETLFAWAQAERKLDDCDKAVELYNELLALDLPAENKQVIETQVGECKADPRATGRRSQKPASEPEPPPEQRGRAEHHRRPRRGQPRVVEDPVGDGAR